MAGLPSLLASLPPVGFFTDKVFSNPNEEKAPVQQKTKKGYRYEYRRD